MCVQSLTTGAERIVLFLRARCAGRPQLMGRSPAAWQAGWKLRRSRAASAAPVAARHRPRLDASSSTAKAGAGEAWLPGKRREAGGDAFQVRTRSAASPSSMPCRRLASLVACFAFVASSSSPLSPSRRPVGAPPEPWQGRKEGRVRVGFPFPPGWVVLVLSPPLAIRFSPAETDPFLFFRSFR